MVEPIRLTMARADLRERAFRLAMESFGDAIQRAPSSMLLDRATEIERFLTAPFTPERPHHACREPECCTPSGKIACHTCAEAWPCSTELRKRAGS